MVFGKHFSKYYIKYLWFFLIGAAILITINWIQLQVPRMIGEITDIFYPENDYIEIETIDSASVLAKFETDIEAVTLDKEYFVVDIEAVSSDTDQKYALKFLVNGKEITVSGTLITGYPDGVSFNSENWLYIPDGKTKLYIKTSDYLSDVAEINKFGILFGENTSGNQFKLNLHGLYLSDEQSLSDNSINLIDFNGFETDSDGVITGNATKLGLVAIITDNYKIDGADIDEINGLIIMILIYALIIALGRFLWRFAIFGTSRQIEYEIRKVMFLHATKLPQSYYAHKKVGGLMTHFINDLNTVREAFGPGLLTLIDGIFLGGFSLYFMFELNWEITVIIIIPIILLMIVVWIVNKNMRLKFKIRQDSFEKMSDFVNESFSGISVIKAYVREIHEIISFKKRSDDFYQKNIKYVKQMTVMQIFVSVMANIIILVIIAVSGYLLISTVGIFTETNTFKTGDLVAYQAYYMQLMWPISAITRFFYITSQAKASSKRIEEFLDADMSVRDSENAIEILDLKGNIKVNNLSFTYPDSELPVLKNMSFTINEGENVGILGKTGSGKTTFVDLLMRIYNSKPQSIFIGDNDIMDIKVNSVRNAIGYVPQDSFLFSDTIASNIDFSHAEIDMKRVKEAATLSDVDGNIEEFPEKYETVLGERGVTISGGQKQRISIARALCKDPNILILDDSVSAVDTKTEEAIITNLHRIRKGKTTIFIAHRISTVKNMDKIILFDDGNVAAIGSHSELLATSALYRDMVRRQQLENIVKGVE